MFVTWNQAAKHFVEWNAKELFKRMDACAQVKCVVMNANVPYDLYQSHYKGLCFDAILIRIIFNVEYIDWFQSVWTSASLLKHAKSKLFFKTFWLQLTWLFSLSECDESKNS